MGGSRRGGRWSRLGGLRTHTRGCDARGPLVAPRTRERAPVPAPRPRRPRAAGAERRRARAAGAKRLHRRTLTIEARDDVPTLTGRVDDAPQGGRSRGRSIQIDRRLTACMREYASTASIGFFRAAQGYMYILVHLSLGDVLVSPLLSPQDTSRDISWSQRESRCKHPKNRASSRSVSTPPPRRRRRKAAAYVGVHACSLVTGSEATVQVHGVYILYSLRVATPDSQDRSTLTLVDPQAWTSQYILVNVHNTYTVTVQT